MESSATRSVFLQTLGGLLLASTTFTRPKPLLLLTYLSLEGQQSRRHVAELFWPTAADHMKSLTVALTQLRQGVPGAIEADESKLSTTLESDLTRLMQALAQEDVTSVFELYRGSFLEGFFLYDWSEELEEWVYRRREEIALEVRKLFLKTAEREAKAQTFDKAGLWAERAYKVAGAPALEPEELVQVQSLLLVGQNATATQVEKEAEDIGIKLLTLEEAKANFAATPTIANNLPALPPFFVGRDSEVNVACHWLEKECRLITLLGPGGVGKTRLSLEIAHHALRRRLFEDGVYFVPLAAISNPSLVLPSIAQTLGIAEEATKSVLASLTSALRNKHLLLVLDNLEQIMSAATAIAELLAHCPHLVVVVTSRMALHLSFEQEFPVLPLALPGSQLSLEAIKHFPSVELFVERAKAVQPTFELTNENALAVAKICTRLDGLPLAIELAAARVKVFSPQTILERLERRLELLNRGMRDRPERHQTLRQALAWSYDLLSTEEQTLFRRLAIFTGGFTLEAAEAVTSPLDISVIDGVAALLDKSLLYQTSVGGRFSMLETLREFGLEKLEERGERESVARRHSEFFLKFAETLEPSLIGQKQKETVDTLGRDHDNLRAVLDRAQLQNDVETGLRLGAALWRFWNVRGYSREGRSWLAGFVHASASVVHEEAKAKALNALGTLIFQTSSFAEARPYFESSLALWRKLDDEDNAITALNNLTWVLLHTGQVQPCRTSANDALKLARKLQQPRAEALALNNLGWLEQYQGSFVASRHLLEGSLALREKIKDERGVAFAQVNLALTLVYLAEYDLARGLIKKAFETMQRLEDKQLLAHAYSIEAVLEMFCDNQKSASSLMQQSLGLWREVGNDEGLGLALILCSEVMLHDPHLAETMLGEAFTLNQKTGSPWYFTHSLYIKGRVAFVKGEYDDAHGYLQEGLNYCETLGSRFWKFLCLESLAELYLAENKVEQSLEALATARDLREECSCPVPRYYLKTYQKMLETLRETLGKQFEDFCLSARAGSIA